MQRQQQQQQQQHEIIHEISFYKVSFLGIQKPRWAVFGAILGVVFGVVRLAVPLCSAVQQGWYTFGMVEGSNNKSLIDGTDTAQGRQRCMGGPLVIRDCRGAPNGNC